MSDETKSPRPGSAQTPLLTDASVSMAIRFARWEALTEAVDAVKATFFGTCPVALSKALAALAELRSAAKPKPRRTTTPAVTGLSTRAVSASTSCRRTS
jgi:hypothetical protein